jgi:hypothetical protein
MKFNTEGTWWHDYAWDMYHTGNAVIEHSAEHIHTLPIDPVTGMLDVEGPEPVAPPIAAGLDTVYAFSTTLIEHVRTWLAPDAFAPTRPKSAASGPTSVVVSTVAMVVDGAAALLNVERSAPDVDSAGTTPATTLTTAEAAAAAAAATPTLVPMDIEKVAMDHATFPTSGTGTTLGMGGAKLNALDGMTMLPVESVEVPVAAILFVEAVPRAAEALMDHPAAATADSAADAEGGAPDADTEASASLAQTPAPPLSHAAKPAELTPPEGGDVFEFNIMMEMLQSRKGVTKEGKKKAGLRASRLKSLGAILYSYRHGHLEDIPERWKKAAGMSVKELPRKKTILLETPIIKITAFYANQLCWAKALGFPW